ncbi:unnamed protein product [Rotaria sp. Silwood1]|nr:unnamed protein product [Rotaria sp. Silwood1]
MSSVNTGTTGVTTRYWDCCKASCAWPGKAQVTNPVKTCSSDGVTAVDSNAQSGCDGGNAYMCNNQQPWSVNTTLAYGYAAANIAGQSEATWCCACYALHFTSGSVIGKQLVVQVTNTGGDLGNNHFDLQMPGGGVVTKNTPAISHTVIKNGQGAVYEWQSDTITVRLTGAQTQGLFTLTEDVMKPTFKLGLHLHRKHAETFHIIEGDVEFRLGTETHVAQAGTTIHVPSNTPHAVQVINGKQARMIMLYSPAGFENFLKEMKTFTDEQFADEIFMKAFNDKYDNIQLE